MKKSMWIVNKNAQLLITFCVCFLAALVTGLVVDLVFDGMGSFVFGAVFGFLFFDPAVIWWRRTYGVRDNQ